MIRAQWKSGQVEVQELGSHAVIKITDKWKRGIVMQIHLALEECKVDVLQSNVTTIGDNIVQFTTIQVHEFWVFGVLEMEQVKVLNTFISPFGMRVLIGLEEKGVKYEYQEEVLSNKSDLLLQMNPVHKKVPVLIHNGQPICESLIILQYIDETWDSKQFLPSKPYDRALARFWADFIDKKFFDSVIRILMSEDKAQEEAKHDMFESFQILEATLKEMSAGGSLPFFSGNNFGFLDIAFIPYASFFQALETIGNFKILFESEYPLLDSWVKKCMERGSVKKALASPDQVLEYALQERRRILTV